MMKKYILTLRAYFELIAYDLFMWRHDFAALHRRIRAFPLKGSIGNADVTTVVGSALEIACCFYPKQVLCLQRSTVLVRLLRANGISAQMLIGAQKLPFKAHAWVEVNGKVINDRLASREQFLILEVF